MLDGLSSDLQEAAAVGVHVGPGVLGLALLQEDVWHDLVQLTHQTEQGVIWKMLQGKLSLAYVARVRLTQHCMPIARNNLQRRSPW